jgi:hypothetical protein
MSNDPKNYIGQENILIIGGVRLDFDGKKVKDVIEISDMIILLAGNLYGGYPNENVYGVSLQKKRIEWQISKLEFTTFDNETFCPFVEMRIFGNLLILINWCDIYLIVDPLNGEILFRSEPKKS